MTVLSRTDPRGPGSPARPYPAGTAVRIHRHEYPDATGVVISGGVAPANETKGSKYDRCLYMVVLDEPHELWNGDLQTQVVLYNTELEEYDGAIAPPTEHGDAG